MKSILLSLGLIGCTFQYLTNQRPTICTTEKIVNGDFSKTTCTNANCIWNKSNYNNDVEGW
jgi:hypothetical protein